MKNLIAPISLTLLVSACVQYQDIDTSPVDVAFSSQTARANVADYSTVDIRTTTGLDSKRSEMIGARCSIKGVGYSTSVVTPAKVNLPTYLGKTDPVTVTCSNGSKTVTEEVIAVNETLKRLNSSSSSGGIAGIIVTAVFVGVVKGTRDVTKDEYGYRSPIEVKFE